MRRPFKLYLAETTWRAGMRPEQPGMPLVDEFGLVIEFSEAACRKRAGKIEGHFHNRTFVVVSYKRLGD